MNLNDRKWINFKIQDIFNIGTGASISKNKLTLGTTPRISATTKNNGIMGFFNTSGNKNERIFKNVISVTFLGIDGPIFYHDYEASFDMKVHSLSLKNYDLNKSIALFLIPILKRSFWGFNYGNQLSSSDLKNGNIKLFLPVTENKTPDWSFMEKYITEKWRGYTVPSLEISGDKPFELNGRKWSAFSLGNTNVFTLAPTLNGIDENKLNLSGKGIFPYVTRSDKNNGIVTFIPEQSKDVNPGNTISIGLDTQTVFYQPIPYYTGQNIQVLSFQHANIRTSTFLIPLIKKQLENLNWGGNGATLSRLKAKKILLPTTSKNQPDWKFMEEYIKSLPNSKLL